MLEIPGGREWWYNVWGSMSEIHGGILERDGVYAILICKKKVDWMKCKCYNNAIFKK